MDKLTDEEKTIVLAKLARLEPEIESNGVVCVDLYDPANMALAWQVLNWADGFGFFSDLKHEWEAKTELSRVLVFSQDMSPAAAQRAWLDKILELAIEAGMVKNEH